MSTKPIIFLAWANDREEPTQFLKALEPEKTALHRILSKYQEKEWGLYHSAGSSEPEELSKDLAQCSKKITVFHFSGHANGTLIQLESQVGEAIRFSGKNLLALLAEEPLKLVFLNACATYDHVARLFETGIPAVIATTDSISDQQARIFSERFYDHLVGGKSLQAAFQAAKAVIEPEENNFARVYRGLKVEKDAADEYLSWGLYVQDDDVLKWTLENEFITKELTNIPVPPPTFTGRKGDLKNIDNILSQNQSLLLVNGLGGIGKTTVAKRFVQQHYARYRHIAWVSVTQDPNEAEIQSTARVLANNIELFKHLGLTFSTEQSEAERLDQVLGKLKSLPGPNLLVIDNATASLIDIHEKLPTPPNWQVLITSRSNMEAFEMYHLDQLTPEEAEALFLKLYPAASRYLEDVRALLKEIGYHTLTLELLARACARSLSLKPAKVLEKIKTKSFHEISQKVWSDHGKAKQAVYAYLLAAFDLANLDEGAKLQLCQWSVLPSVEISIDLILQIFSLDEDQTNDFEETLRSLTDAGWITYNSENDTYRCHQMIQEVARYQLKPNTENCTTVIDGVADLLSLDDTKDNPIDKFPYIIYGESLLLHIDDHEGKVSVLQNNLSLRYQDLGQYETAAKLLEKALASVEKNFGDDHPSTAISRSNLGMVYQALGQYETAAKLLEKAVASDEKNFGDDHPSTATRRSNLGMVYQDLGQYETAAKLLEKALASDEKNFGDDHPSTAISRSNLGMVYQDLGQYETAAKLLEKALASDEKNFGDDHPSTAISRSNLGMVYQDLGQYETAAKLLEKALASDEKNFGDDHPSTARSRSNLALVYKALGQYETAAKLLEKALASDEKNFGDDHPETAKKRSNLGMVYKDLGQYETAAKLLEKALASDEKNFGDDHPSTSNTQFCLAYVYHSQKKYQEAEELYQAALRTFIIFLGDNHPTIHNLKGHLNRLMKDMKKSGGGGGVKIYLIFGRNYLGIKMINILERHFLQ